MRKWMFCLLFLLTGCSWSDEPKEPVDYLAFGSYERICEGIRGKWTPQVGARGGEVMFTDSTMRTLVHGDDFYMIGGATDFIADLVSSSSYVGSGYYAYIQVSGSKLFLHDPAKTYVSFYRLLTLTSRELSYVELGYTGAGIKTNDGGVKKFYRVEWFEANEDWR